MNQQKIIDSPLGKMRLISNGKQLTNALFIFDDEDVTTKTQFDEIPIKDDPLLVEAAKQLEEYFNKRRETFDLPLLTVGTTFRKKVWEVLNDIPFGEVLTYKKIAEIVDSPKASRAVGGACRANPFMVIIPCHRVLSSAGAYTGYAGSRIHIKEYLLKFEAEKKCRE